jgi:subtilisin family serine protease
MIGVRLTIHLTVGALTTVFAWGNGLLEETLLKKLAETGPDEFIHVDLIMADRVDPGEIEAVLEGASSYVRRDYVIRELKTKAEEAQAELRERLDAAEAEGSAYDVRYVWLNNTVALFATPDLIQELLTREDIERVHYDPGHFTLFESGVIGPNETSGYYGDRGRGNSWNVEQIGADDAWAEGYTGDGVVVAVLDSGCDYNHPDLSDHVWVNDDEIPNNAQDDDDNGYADDVHGWNFIDDDNDVENEEGWLHGSRVTGIIAGDGTQGTNTGVAPDAEFMICVISPPGAGTGIFESQVWEAMEYAFDNGAHVINMSAGLYHFLKPDRATWRETSEDLMTGAMVLVFAAGNGRAEEVDNPPEELATPADVPGVISLTATDDEDVLWEGTSRGPVTWEDVDPYYDYDYPPGLTKPDFSAPGVNTVTIIPGATGPPWYFSSPSATTGTSFAAPHAAGLAALILEAVPGLTNDQIYESMEETAEDLGYITGMDNDYGWGLIQCLDAIEYAENEWGRRAAGGLANKRLEEEGARVTIKSCTPNPVCTGPVVVNYYVDEGFKGSVTVRVYDITGREVREIRDEDPVSGPNALKITTDGFGSGVYIINLTGGDNSAAVKMVVLN